MTEKAVPSVVDGLSIVLPAYNEAANITAAVERALAVLPDFARQYEILVVNDGSRDQTAEIGQGLATQHYPQVRLLSHLKNQGYGAALRTGFRHTRYGLVFFTDSDNQFDISELGYFLPLMEHYDVATGFRVYRYDPVVRCMLSWTYNRLVHVLFGLRVRDVDCAFKLFRREVLEKITLECDNFFASTELLAKARKWNFRIIEKGVRHYPRMAGETTVRASDIPRTLREITRMWRNIYFPSRRHLSSLATPPLPDDNVIEFLPTGAGA